MARKTIAEPLTALQKIDPIATTGTRYATSMYLPEYKNWNTVVLSGMIVAQYAKAPTTTNIVIRRFTTLAPALPSCPWILADAPPVEADDLAGLLKRQHKVH